MSEIRSDDWSNLSSDILRLILEVEGLASKDFQRARTVCSHWYTVSTTCVRPIVYPWRVFFDEDSTFLLDPGEDKIHEIGHPDLELFKTHVMASCSHWLLIGARPNIYYLQNVFTRERINLPRIKSFASQKPGSSCLWINERTKDYVVAWSSEQGNLFSYKKGDVSWWSHQDIKCECMAYKDENLYVYTFDRCIKILDLSSALREEVVLRNPYRNHPFHIDSHPMSLVITSSGKVLIVVSFRSRGFYDNNHPFGLYDYNRPVGFRKKRDNTRSFKIYEMNLESNKWERVVSLGGEMLIFGYGVTIEPPIKYVSGWGIKNDAICFGDDDLFTDYNESRNNNCGVFDLTTSTLTSLDVPFTKSFWFVPGYAKSSIERLVAPYG